MAIFIKLFAISIVAKSFLGFSNNLEIISNGLDSSVWAVSISDWLRENKATSAPETKAEHNRSKNSKTKPETIETSIASKENIKL